MNMMQLNRLKRKMDFFCVFVFSEFFFSLMSTKKCTKVLFSLSVYRVSFS